MNTMLKRPKNTMVINGRPVNLNYIFFTLAMKYEAWELDNERYLEESDRTMIAGLTNIIADSYFSKTGQATSLLSRYLQTGNTDKLSKFIEDQAAELGTRSIIPMVGMVRQVGQAVSPTAKKAISFDEKLLKFSGLNAFIGHEAFDYRGRSYKIGQANTGSLDGIFRAFMKDQPSDEIDSIVFEFNPAIMGTKRSSEVLQVWNEETKQYEAVSDEDYYEIAKKGAQNFNELLGYWSNTFAFNRTPMSRSAAEELAREYEEINGRQATLEELNAYMSDRYKELGLPTREGVKTEISKINTLAENKAIYDYYVANNMRLNFALMEAEKDWNAAVQVFKNLDHNNKEVFLKNIKEAKLAQ